MNIITTTTITMARLQNPANLGVWFHIKSCDEKGDRVVGILHDETPDLTGYTNTRASQVDEEADVDLGGTCTAAYFRQAPGESVGAGDAWVHILYR